MNSLAQRRVNPSDFKASPPRKAHVRDFVKLPALHYWSPTICDTEVSLTSEIGDNETCFTSLSEDPAFDMGEPLKIL